MGSFGIFLIRRDEAEQLKAANNSLRLELERFQGLETQLQVQLCACIQMKHNQKKKKQCKWGNQHHHFTIIFLTVMNIIIVLTMMARFKSKERRSWAWWSPWRTTSFARWSKLNTSLWIFLRCCLLAVFVVVVCLKNQSSKNDQLRQVEQILKRTFCGCFNTSLWIFVKCFFLVSIVVVVVVCPKNHLSSSVAKLRWHCPL